jgi:carboxypeptidase A2
MTKVAVSLMLLAAVAAVGAIRYDGYRVLEVGPLRSDEDVKNLMMIVDDDERMRKVVLLSEHVTKKQPVSLAVAPEVAHRVHQFLISRNIPSETVSMDLQASFDELTRDNQERFVKVFETMRDDPTQFDHTAYLTYADQIGWLNAVSNRSPIAQIFTLGMTYEGRPIAGLSINAGQSTLPIIWVDSNIHAREWISSATTLYIIDEILFGDSQEAVRLRTNYRWYFAPNINPDGYEYTWTSDRLWRKTRSPNDGSICVGTDPNRNWDGNWGGEGASALPCSDTYRGTHAFSEVETRTVSEFIKTISSETNVFISIHCYSNLWLVPWGGTQEHPADYDELMRVGNAAAAAIQRVNGLVFEVGTPPDILYVASGGSFDWAKGKENIQYAYSPELRPATAGEGGFNIPASNIIPSGREMFAGVYATVTEARHKL